MYFVMCSNDCCNNCRIDKVIEELDSIKESVKMSKSATSGLDDTIKGDGTDSVVPLSSRLVQIQSFVFMAF